MLAMCLLFLAIMTVSSSAELAGAESSDATLWNRFRGPNGSGVASRADFPLNWSENDYLWRTPLPGVGHSSPVVWKDRVYLSSGIEENATRIILSVRTADGRVEWSKRFPSKPHDKNRANSYGSSTPTVDAQRVYACWATPEDFVVIALDRKRGQQLWRRDLGPFVAEHGFGSSPILWGDLVIVANEQNETSSIVALDQKTGQIRWTAPRRIEKAAYATPCVFHPQQGPDQLITVSWAHGVSSLDPATGKENWELPILKFRVVASPMAAGGLIFAQCGGGGSGKQFVAVRPGNPATGRPPELAYEIKDSLPYVPIPVCDGTLVYYMSDSGVATCFRATNGELVWRERVGGKFFASPILVGDRLYCVSREGKMVILAAGEKFEVLSTVDLGEGTSSTPAVVGGVMYIRTLSQLAALGTRKAGKRER